VLPVERGEDVLPIAETIAELGAGPSRSSRPRWTCSAPSGRPGRGWAGVCMWAWGASSAAMPPGRSSGRAQPLSPRPISTPRSSASAARKAFPPCRAPSHHRDGARPGPRRRTGELFPGGAVGAAYVRWTLHALAHLRRRRGRRGAGGRGRRVRPGGRGGIGVEIDTADGTGWQALREIGQRVRAYVDAVERAAGR